MDTPDLHTPSDAVIDYGFAIRGEVYDVAEDTDDPGKVLERLRKLAAEDPKGLACAIFAHLIEQDGKLEAEMEPTPKLAAFYWDWKTRFDLRSDPNLGK